jgi:glycosidase
MQWTAETTTAGFTTATPWRAPGTKTAIANVAMQEKDPASLLNHYRALVALRKAHPALQTGDLTLVETGNPGLYAILRCADSENLLVLINLSGQPVSDYALSIQEPLLPTGAILQDLLFGAGKISGARFKDGRFETYKPKPELAPYEMLIIRWIPWLE